MSLSIGIVGLPNVGKSSLFTALTKKSGFAANYPFATIEPNVGLVPVPDKRLDGLAASVTVFVMLAYSAIGFLAGERSISLFSLSIVGSCLGFLVYNHHPAKVFMGDTGSLALGGAVAAAAIGSHTELLLVIIGGVYVLETLSVIIQVTYFKLTGGKRVFRMTPIHHHFELGGWKETKVVARFSMLSLLLSLVGFFIYTNRF